MRAIGERGALARLRSLGRWGLGALEDNSISSCFGLGHKRVFVPREESVSGAELKSSAERPFLAESSPS